MITQLKTLFINHWKPLWNLFRIGILLFFVFSFFTMKMPFVTILRAVAYILFGILLPGYLLARLIASVNNSSEMYGLCLLFGIGLAIAIYFLDACFMEPLLKRNLFSFCLGPALSIPAVVFLLKDLKSGRRTKKSFTIDLQTQVLLLITLMISFSSLALYSGISARIVGVSTTYRDVLWNIGNTASLDRGWPADNLQYLGKALNSNIFSNIFRVVAARNIGTSAVSTFLVFSCFVTSPLLIFSLDSLGNIYLRNRVHSWKYVFIYIFSSYISRAILFFYNIKLAYNIAVKSGILTGISNLIVVPNGTDLAIPGCVFLILLIIKSIQEERVRGPIAFGVFIAAALTTGAKSVFTICVLGALTGTLIFRLLQRKKVRDEKRIVVLTVLSVAGFLISYFGVVRGNAVYMPATQCTAEYMDSDDENYPEARQELLTYFEKKNYHYLIVSSEGWRQNPIVRQTKQGTYAVCGSQIACTELSEMDALDILCKSEIQTGGIIGGKGGRFQSLFDDQYIYVSNCYGFLRFTEEGETRSKICFYGRRPQYQAVSNKKSSLLSLFPFPGNGTEYNYNSSYSSFSINQISKRTEVYKWLMSGSSLKTPLIWIYQVLFIFVYLFLARPLTTIPFILWIIERLRKWREITEIEMLLCGTAICGLIVLFALNVDGNSQVYFFLLAIVCFDLLGIQWITANYRLFRPSHKRMLIIILCISIVTAFETYAFYGGRGLLRLEQAYSGKYQNAKPSADLITSYETQAMEWLRDCSPKDAVVAYNRHYFVPDKQRFEHPLPNSDDSRYYYYTAYSERQAFLGSWAYVSRTAEMQQMLEERLITNDALFDPFCSNKREIMEANGISYLVASQYVGYGTYITDPDLKCVYRNRDIAIYTLNSAIRQY